MEDSEGSEAKITNSSFKRPVYLKSSEFMWN